MVRPVGEGIAVAVVGHVEWVEFARVKRVPLPGEIIQAADSWQEPAGGGAVAAVQLAKLAGAATLFTALGDDHIGRQVPEGLASHGVRVAAAFRPTPQRKAFTFVDTAGERTITTMAKRLDVSLDEPLPWGDLARADAVYLTAGDVGAVRAARRARVLVATSRVLDRLQEAGVPLDALVGSGRDPGERYTPGDLNPPPRLVVVTAGSAGGSFELPGVRSGSYLPAPLPGPIVDAYGCGDSFAAGLTYGLGIGLDAEDALRLAARCGAACLTGRGPYEGQLTLKDLGAGSPR
ncbi:MAG: PfkB family carbohydrate kinase [Actinomycetota bacterium]